MRGRKFMERGSNSQVMNSLRFKNSLKRLLYEMRKSASEKAPNIDSDFNFMFPKKV
jgi:hypothetical protein